MSRNELTQEENLPSMESEMHNKFALAKDDRQWIQLFKMAELGVMSLTILHEIRQPLFAMKGFLQILAMELSNNTGDIDKKVDKVLAFIEEIENLTTSFLDFSRNPKENMMPIEIKESVEGALKLLNGKLKRSRIQVHVDYDLLQTPLVYGNLSTLQQVIVNLLLNSIDALEEKELHEGRHIWISVQTNDSNSFLDVFIADNGVGINPQHSKQIFEYFFTTKPEGKGTGLGLAISHEIVNAHGGILVALDLTLDPPLVLFPKWHPLPVTMFKLSLPVLSNNNQ